MINMFIEAPSIRQDFNCQVYVTSVERYVELGTRWDELSYGRGWQCLIDSAERSLPALATIDGLLRLLSDVSDIAADLSSDLSMVETLVPYLNMTLRGAVRQRPSTYCLVVSFRMSTVQCSSGCTYTSMILCASTSAVQRNMTRQHTSITYFGVKKSFG